MTLSSVLASVTAEEKLTQEKADEIIKISSRCTQASLLAFGIDGWPQKTSGCLEFFSRHGYTLARLESSNRGMKKLQSMLFFKPESDYFIITQGHAMSIRNGILVDTDTGKFDNRKVLFVWEVRNQLKK